MMERYQAAFEKPKKGGSKQPYESPSAMPRSFGKQDVVCASGEGTYKQELFAGGDTYGFDYEAWD